MIRLTAIGCALVSFAASAADIVPLNVTFAVYGDFVAEAPGGGATFNDPTLPFWNSHDHLYTDGDGWTSDASALYQLASAQALQLQVLFSEHMDQLAAGNCPYAAGKLRFLVTDDTTWHLDIEFAAEGFVAHGWNVSLVDLTPDGSVQFSAGDDVPFHDDPAPLVAPNQAGDLLKGHEYEFTYFFYITRENVSLETSAAGFVNFSTGAPRPSPCLKLPGDFDGDGDVDISDFAFFITLFGTTCGA